MTRMIQKVTTIRGVEVTAPLDAPCSSSARILRAFWTSLATLPVSAFLRPSTAQSCASASTISGRRLRRPNCLPYGSVVRGAGLGANAEGKRVMGSILRTICSKIVRTGSLVAFSAVLVGAGVAPAPGNETGERHDNGHHYGWYKKGKAKGRRVARRTRRVVVTRVASPVRHVVVTPIVRHRHHRRVVRVYRTQGRTVVFLRQNGVDPFANYPSYRDARPRVSTITTRRAIRIHRRHNLHRSVVRHSRKRV